MISHISYLMRYSPYHQLPQRLQAPAILTVVSDEDDRVAPWHGYKMHAAWLSANASDLVASRRAGGASWQPRCRKNHCPLCRYLGILVLAVGARLKPQRPQSRISVPGEAEDFTVRYGAAFGRD